jgi:hypothetical protein
MMPTPHNPRHSYPRAGLRGAPLIAATIASCALLAGVVTPSGATFTDAAAATTSVRMVAPPAIVNGLRVVAVDATHATLGWNAVAGATSYTLTSGATVVNTAATTAAIAGSPGSTVNVRVHAANADGVGPDATLSVTFGTDILAGLQLQRLLGLKAYLGWSAYPGATGYRVTAATGQTTDTASTSAMLTLNSASTTIVTITAYASGTPIATSTISVSTAPNALQVNQALRRRAVSNDFDTSPDDSIVSSNGLYALVLQVDGNLVLYQLSATTMAATPIAESRTDVGAHAGWLGVQSDGNVVLRDDAMNVLRATGTDGSGVNALILQDDGNLVAYTPGFVAKWALTWWSSNPGPGASFLTPW